MCCGRSCRLARAGLRKVSSGSFPPQALFGELRWDVTILTVLYSLAGLGIAIVNDFKSIEGDRCIISLAAESLDSAQAAWMTP